MTARAPAVLALEDGTVYRGRAFGSVGETLGEAVFATGMTGYQETLTDPSYRRQIVAMTFPHIGNTGVNDADAESDRIWPAGFVLREPSRIASSWRSRGTLEDELAAFGVVGICEVDTRALTRRLRRHGAMRAGISSRDLDEAALLRRVRAAAPMTGADLVSEVTCAEPYTVAAQGPTRFRVAALDLGIKRNTPRRLAARGIETTVLPAHSGLEQVLEGSPDAVFLSNGPGDPATADAQVELTRQLLRRRTPLFGICFGNQILGRALGLSTYKLPFGHRGVNQPVRPTAGGKVEITAHNHGFALRADSDRFDTEFGEATVSHRCLNDDVVEGLACRDVPAFSVQYHPEAAAGPHDADYLFDRFATLIGEHASA